MFRWLCNLYSQHPCEIQRITSLMLPPFIPELDLTLYPQSFKSSILFRLALLAVSQSIILILTHFCNDPYHSNVPPKWLVKETSFKLRLMTTWQFVKVPCMCVCMYRKCPSHLLCMDYISWFLLPGALINFFLTERGRETSQLSINQLLLHMHVSLIERWADVGSQTEPLWFDTGFSSMSAEVKGALQKT